jgi:uncharacterized membrane protein
MPPARKKTSKPPERKRPTGGTTYPSAPTDPAERLAHFRQRNALIAGVEPDAYEQAARDVADRARQHGDRDLAALRKT